jgi:long-chain acyl-CoA synthetase
VRIIEGYGLTETSPVICCNRLPVPRFGTVGRPIFGTSVRISEEGEIQVKGPGVTGGYLDDEEATREAFTEDGWFRTGDVGELDEDGYLRVTGRLKNILVLSTGKNVAPEPVEAAIAARPHISQAVLVGDGRKYVAALVVPDYDAVRRTLGVDDGGEKLARDERCRGIVGREIEEACRRFAPYERPKKFALLPRELSVEEGELTPTLKVRMHVVRERYAREIESLYQS